MSGLARKCLVISLLGLQWVHAAHRLCPGGDTISDKLRERLVWEIDHCLYDAFMLFQLYQSGAIEQPERWNLRTEYTILYYKTLLFRDRYANSKRTRQSRKPSVGHDMINAEHEKDYLQKLADLQRDRAACLRYAKYVYNSGSKDFYRDPVFAAIVADAVRELAGCDETDLDFSRSIHHVLLRERESYGNENSEEFAIEVWRLFQALADLEEPRLIIHLADVLDASRASGLKHVESMLNFLCPHIPPEIQRLNLRGDWYRSVFKHLTWKGTVVSQVGFSKARPRYVFFYDVVWEGVYLDLYESWGDVVQGGGYPQYDAKQFSGLDEAVQKQICLEMLKGLVLRKAEFLKTARGEQQINVGATGVNVDRRAGDREDNDREE